MCAPPEPQALQGRGDAALQVGKPSFLIESPEKGKLREQAAVG
jgi:hypothetical protein